MPSIDHNSSTVRLLRRTLTVRHPIGGTIGSEHLSRIKWIAAQSVVEPPNLCDLRVSALEKVEKVVTAIFCIKEAIRYFPSRTMTFLHLLAAGLAAFTVIAQDDGLTVNTQQGPIKGTSPTAGVRRFLGIPYGIANRWEAPHTPPVRSAPFQANSFGDSCVQLLSPSSLEFLKLIGITNPQVPESENCLSVNIWAPSLSRKQGTAVMIWIYGGSDQFGTVS